MKYDLIVIGAGSGGLSIGLGMHELGFKVLLIDKSDQAIGGECLNNGCVPSKALIHVTKLINQGQKAREFGLQVEGKVEIQKVWDYVKKSQQAIREHENAQYFRSQGLDVVLGHAEFSGPDRIKVDDREYRGKKIIIATGSKPRKLKVPGVESVNYYDNENIWDLPELPEKALFIGAGPISMELGQCFARMGSKVTMLESSDRIMSIEAPEITEILQARSEQLGIDFNLNTDLKEFRDGHIAVAEKDGETLEIGFDIVVVGIGRVVDHSGLSLSAAGIKTDEQGLIEVDKYLGTSNKRVYVTGDAANRLKFSHGAELQATLLINNFFSPWRKKLSYDHFSWVTFTNPEVASFGLTESQIKDRGLNYQKLTLDYDEDDRAITSDYAYGKLILLVKPGWFSFSDAKILGGTMIAPQAGEMFQELVLARSAGLGIKSLFDKIYAYPTGGRVNKTIALNQYRAALKPWMTKIMKMFY